MRSWLLVARREFIGYWTTPVAYVVLVVFLALSGIFFFGQLSEFVAASRAAQGTPVDVNQELVRPYLYSASVMLLFLLPLVSMRLIAEETRLGTLEILLTTPLRESALTFGKYVASLGLLVVLLLGPLAHVLLLFAFGRPELAPILTGFLGLFLTGAAYLSLGLCISALTQNQIVAGAVSFAIFLALWLLHWLGQSTHGLVSRVITYASFVDHFDSFGKGVLASTDLVFYVSWVALGLYGATQAILSRRWKA
ncbi:MAG TPA: ABC transporter permease [Candidatus Eisenbacteria bacterium]|nr:ABC transporter permease [Candidatus Eisenbacteria bacterium]